MIHRTAIIGEPAEMREFLSSADGALQGDFHEPIVARSAHIAAYVTVDAGSKRATYVGEHAFVMKHSHIGHDVTIESGCEVAANVVVAGFAILRRNVKVGCNAVILPYVCVGEGSIVGAGAVVNRHVLPGATVSGNPARATDGLVEGPGDWRCGCWRHTVWERCPQHGSDPIC